MITRIRKGEKKQKEKDRVKMPAEYSTFPATTTLRLETVPSAVVVVVVVVVRSRKKFRDVTWVYAENAREKNTRSCHRE